MPDETYIVSRTSLSATADAIRAKGGTSAQIEYTVDGFADAIQSLSSDSAVNVVGTWINGMSYLTPNAVTNISTSGETATTGYSCGYMSCIPGDVFYLTGLGGSGAKFWVWTKENGDIISRANSSVSDTDLKLTAPVGAAYLLYNTETATDHFVIRTASIGVGQWIDGYGYSIQSSVTNISIHDLTAFNGYSCGYLSCVEGDKFYITGTGGSGAKLWAWLKSNGDIISRANSSVVASDLELTAPTDAAYLIYNAETAQKHFVIGNITPHGGGGGSVSWDETANQDITIVADTPNYFVITDYTIPILANETYRVTWGSGGTVYICETIPDNTGTAYDGYLFGNAGVVGGTDTGEPFLIYRDRANRMVGVANQGAGTIHIIIERQVSGGGSSTLVSKTITANGVYDPADDSADGYSEVTVALPAGTEGTPTATKGVVTNHAVSVTPSVTNTGGVISGGTHTGTAITVAASELVSDTYSVTSSGTKDVTNYASASVPAGTVTAPSSISGTSATVSTGTNTLTLTKTISVTPSVSTTGFVSSGTAGNSSVSLTASVATQAAQTIHPSTSDQTIATSTYLTGAQTIKGVVVSGLEAGNIKSGVTVKVGDSTDDDCVTSVVGTYGGASGVGTLLTTYSMGTISTSSTNAADTGKSISVSNVNDYDLLIVETSVNSVTNNRHTATVGVIFLTAGSSVGTKNGATVVTAKWNSKISSQGVTTTRTGTTAYGIYPNSCSVATSNNVTTATIPMYQRYNSTSTGTINGTYTARVYGVNLYDLIGG